MNVLVHAGMGAGGTSAYIDEYAISVVAAVARRPDTRVTVIAERASLPSYEQFPSVVPIDHAVLDSEHASIARCDLLIQLHQFQTRPVDLPTVVVVHDLDVYDAVWMFGVERAPLVRSLHKNVIRADAVVSGSPYVLRQIVELEPLAAGKTVLTVAPPFTAEAEPDEATVKDIRRRFGLDEARPTIVYPSALLPHANHWNLLTAVGELQRSGRELQLLCVGDAESGEWAEAVRRRVEYLALTDVRCPGCVTGTARSALFLAVTGVVSASLTESGGVAAQEALLHNAAMACPATPGLLAQLDRIGLDVPTFDPYDVDAITTALVRLIDDREGIVDGYGKARSVVDEWSWERLADEIVTSVEVVGS